MSVKLGEFHSVLFSLSLSKPSFASTFFKVRVNSGLCGGDNSGAQLGLFFFFFNFSRDHPRRTSVICAMEPSQIVMSFVFVFYGVFQVAAQVRKSGMSCGNSACLR